MPWEDGDAYDPSLEGPEARLERARAAREEALAAEVVRQGVALRRLLDSLGDWDTRRVLTRYVPGSPPPEARW